jgi:hypothetical protein
MNRTSSPRPHASRRRAERRGRRITGAALVAGLLAAATLVVITPGQSGAQSTFVNASVRIDPALPQPGQDVNVSVRIAGCAPGPADVQVLLAADVAGGVEGALMADAPAQTSLLWRTRARLRLPDATQGWYGVRIQCGAFRPPQAPMANTTFAVGANPSAALTLGARTVPQGDSITVSGNDCPGPSVDYEIVTRSFGVGPFVPTASLPTRADGTWSAAVAVPADLRPGPVVVRARCVEHNQYGATVYVSYGNPVDLRIEPAS